MEADVLYRVPVAIPNVIIKIKLHSWYTLPINSILKK
jgi:hypothetical protein